MKLDGKRVVVVGGTSGMGLGAVEAALDAGAEVIAAGRRPVAERKVGVDAPLRLRHATVDVTDEVSVRHLFESLNELDHLFVTATPSGGLKPFLEDDVAGAQRVLHGKFLGSFACARHAAPRMRAGGSITFLTGCVVARPRVGLAMMTATFAALEAFSRALALELAPLRVNTIRPGVIDSDMWTFLDEAGRERLRRVVTETLPVRRIGRIEDVGAAAVFLMTNPYVTGTVLEVSGGETLVTLEV